MDNLCRIGIVSDIHYASAAEQARGNDYEIRTVANPLLRMLLRIHRRFVWMRAPLDQNGLLSAFVAKANGLDHVVANGDYSCNSAFVGVSDDAACQSGRECLGRLRRAFAPRFHATFGDHELGKLSLVGSRGGMRLESWRRACRDLELEPFWRVQLGNYVLLGVVSSLVALPVFEQDTLPAERDEWRKLRADHLQAIRAGFDELQPDQRVLLFCHDPTALPLLLEEESVCRRLPQIEQTIIGHLHSKLVLWKSRRLAGMPQLDCLGHTVRRLSTALRQARHWDRFKIRLCPALGGIELLKDGGYLTATLDLNARRPAEFQFHPIPRSASQPRI